METNQTLWTKTDLIFLLVCSVYIYTHLFVFPAIPVFYEEDHLYFITDAWRMYRGERLYADFFEYTFPGTQVLYLTLFYIFGTKFWLINAVIFIQGLSQTLICLAISKRVMGGNGWYAYLPASIFMFFGFRWFGIDGSHRMLSPIFIWLAILILLNNRTYKRIFLAGLLCALSSYFTQQRGMLALGGFGLFLIFEAIKNKSGWKKLLIDEAVLSGAFVLTLFLLILPFIISAGPSTFFDYTVFYIKYYVKEPTANYFAVPLVFGKVLNQGAMMSLVMTFYYVLIPLIYIVVFIYLWRKKFQTEILLITTVGFCLASGTFAPTPGRVFQICIPGLVVLAWLIFQIKKTDLFVKIAVGSLVLFGCVLALRVQTNWTKFYLDTPTGKIAFLSPETIERYKWLSENAKAGEDVFEVYQTAVNFPLQHPNPTQITFLLDNGYTPEWQVRKAIENLEQKKPRLIIWDGKWNKEASERAKDDPLAPLYDYLRQHYDLSKSFTPYGYREMQVWERKR